MPLNPTRFPDALRRRFEYALSAFCAWSLERDTGGYYVDGNTAYAWQEFLRINVKKGAEASTQEVVTV